MTGVMEPARCGALPRHVIRQDIRQRHRSGQQEPLPAFDTQGAQHFGFFFPLDPLCDQSGIGFLGVVDHRGTQRPARWIFVNSVHQRPIQFDDVGLQPHHLLQAGIPRARVIDRNLDAHGPQIQQRPPQRRPVGDLDMLRYFEDKPPVCLPRKQGDQLARGNGFGVGVERKIQTRRKIIENLQRLTHHADFQLLRKVDAGRVIKPQVRRAVGFGLKTAQRLDPGQSARGQVNDWLVDQIERLKIQCPFNQGHQSIIARLNLKRALDFGLSQAREAAHKVQVPLVQ